MGELMYKARAKVAAAPAAQRMAAGPAGGHHAALQQSPWLHALAAQGNALSQGSRPANRTGLPDRLKAGVEALSGIALDDVHVHYNSPKPAQLRAHAYTRGTEIHVAPGQERHLPHEAWHVVQQAQGRVQPATRFKGMPINTDARLEGEADIMGAHALSVAGTSRHQPSVQRQPLQLKAASGTVPGVIQRVGDKMALTATDVSKESAEIQDLASKLKEIYTEHRKKKSDAREALDGKFASETADIGPKQKYVIGSIEINLFNMLKDNLENQPEKVKNIINNKLEKKLGKKQEDLDRINLSKAEKNSLIDELKIEYSGIYENIFKQIKERSNKPEEFTIKSLEHIVNTPARSYGLHKISDLFVQGYEKNYMATGMKYEKIVEEWKKYAKEKNYSLNTDKYGNFFVKNSQGHFVHIATVYFGDERFEAIPTENIILNQGTKDEERREIFKHRESGVHYVRDAHGLFVRRYVSRALNQFDNPPDGDGVQINADPRPKPGTKPGSSKQTWAQIATLIPNMAPDARNKEILNHQRGKEAQGGSPFVSFTTTKHPIFGSTAKKFGSGHSVATIDLAHIPRLKLFDTHTAAAMKRIYAIDDPVPDMPYAEGVKLYERNSAARDAMRTREIVVAGDIPLEAIIAVKDEIGRDYERADARSKFKRPRSSGGGST
jgi:hypothetical protein